VRVRVRVRVRAQESHGLLYVHKLSFFTIQDIYNTVRTVCVKLVNKYNIVYSKS